MQRCRPLIGVRHCYPERSVLLDTWLVEAFSGELAETGAEGQALSWVPAAQLSEWPLPPADRPIVNAIRLPERYLITPDNVSAASLLAGVTEAITRGVSLIQLRGVSLNEATAPLVTELLRRCASVVLVCNVASVAEIEVALRAGFAGVHLKSSLLMQLQERPVAAGCWLGCSVHSAAELQRAEAIGADFAALSPVELTASHPGQPALGWLAAAKLADAANLPTYALGGLGQADIGQAQLQGFQGVAAIRGLWPV